MSDEAKMLSVFPLSKPVAIKVTALFIVSVLGILLILANFYQIGWPLEVIQKPSINIVWIFYLPTWMLTNAALGGIHEATAWSFIPSVVIAVVAQNSLLWLIVHKLIGLFKKSSETASGSLTQKNKRIIAVAILGIVACMGMWLGEFEWFGGYITTQERIGIVAIVLGFVGSGLVCQRRQISLLVVPLYFVASQAIFIVCIALGQTLYYSPDDGEFIKMFWLALQGRL